MRQLVYYLNSILIFIVFQYFVLHFKINKNNLYIIYNIILYLYHIEFELKLQKYEQVLYPTLTITYLHLILTKYIVIVRT